MDEIILVLSIFVIIIGACIGSFLNVVALRALSGESIVFPSSKCPNCGEKIKWYDNIPVISYLFTFRGKCRNCGCHVSIQYPIVEAITAILFLVVFLKYGISWQTLALWILLCISMVIIITDIKEETVFDRHLWAFIIVSIIYSSLFVFGLSNISGVCLGVIAAVIIMEAIARFSYLLVRKHKQNDENPNDNENNNNEDNSENPTKEEEKEDINSYVQKYKRAFGEGDTYIAAGAGALIGWVNFIAALALAIIFEALCIMPQVLIGLYKKEEYKLIASIIAFIVLSVLYWTLSNTVQLNLFVIFAFIIALIFLGISVIKDLKNIVNDRGFVAIPFGPALIIATFVILFWGWHIVGFIDKYIFLNVA